MPSSIIPESVVSTLPHIDEKVSASVYFDVVEILREYLRSSESKLKDFKELSNEAWNYSNEVNELNKTESKHTQKGAGLADEDVDTIRYWLYSPGDGASKWEEFY